MTAQTSRAAGRDGLDGDVIKRTVSLLVAAIVCGSAAADEGGVSFWLPGNFSSFSATPSEPGWSLPFIYYRSSGDESASKEIPVGGRLVAGVDASADFVFFLPTYVFAKPIAGGQASVTVAAAYGPVDVGIEATLTGPNGGTISGRENDARSGVSDLYPTATLKWNRGVHNWMAYAAAGVPVGTYDPGRLANIGTNHWSVDAGGGYTYFDETWEFSAVLGLTWNDENPDTDYQNGESAHLDWAASRMMSEAWHAGVVGYAYRQLTGDSGAGATLGDFKGRVLGFGPQSGWFLKAGEHDVYANLKGYYEFAAENRAEGWNVWLTVAIPME